MLYKVQLYDLHKELGASFGEFAKWTVPMIYTSAVKEHLSVRSNVGVFDVSHMGRLIVEGKDSFKLLQKLTSKDLSKVSRHRMSGPSAFLNEKGGFRDDVMIYNLGDKWFIVCNAINRVKVVKWIEEWIDRLRIDAHVRDLTFDLPMIAVQGPKSPKVMEVIGLGFVVKLNPLEFRTDVESPYGKVFLISRSGWTGEDGFEIIGDPIVIEKIYRKLIEVGVKPCGIIARDTLRIEMGYVLYGQDIGEDITPIEARYWVWSPKKKDYIGFTALEKKLREGVDRLRYGLRFKKGIRFVPRHGYKVYLEDVVIGEVTSGTFSPILNQAIAMAYINVKHAIMGLSVEVEVRGKRYRAKIVDFPFVER